MLNPSCHGPARRQPWRPALATAVLALLTACGGGGGSDEPPPTRTLAISAANRDQVAQTTATTMLNVGSGLEALPLSAGSDRRSQASVVAVGVPKVGLLPVAAQRLLRQQLALGDGVKRAQAVVGPITTACPYGGSGSVTLDDADGNGDLSPGETMTMRFTSCVAEPGSSVSGELSLVVTAFTELPLMRLAGNMSFRSLAATTADGTVTVDGTAGFEMAEDNATTVRMVITAQTPLSTRLSSPTLNDTVTLATGYRETTVYAENVPVPSTTQFSGRTTLTFDGFVTSSNLGGQYSVATTSPIVQYDIDPYPRSGVVTVQGRTGTLRMTVQSTSDVLLELDADDNGSFESSSTVSWTWLI